MIRSIRKTMTAALVTVCAVATGPASALEGNSQRGQRLFRNCAACHSLEMNRNMTGPSLAGLWRRKAGAQTGFSRYSPALRSSDIVWDDSTLDQWLADPQRLVPGNTMIFQGLKDTQARADLLAYLKEATRPGSHASMQQDQMDGMMGARNAPNLKKADATQRVAAVRYCGDTYRVTTADGRTRDFWERNLRFKTDSSEEGPEKEAPAIVGAGMVGDRASIIFAEPAEISAYIERKC